MMEGVGSCCQLRSWSLKRVENHSRMCEMERVERETGRERGMKENRGERGKHRKVMEGPETEQDRYGYR